MPVMIHRPITAGAVHLLVLASSILASESYKIVDTGQHLCYDTYGVIACPAGGESFAGQDAQQTGNTPGYTDNGDGTVTDLVTGLMWTQSPDRDGDGEIDASDKLSYRESLAGAGSFSLAGYHDWRLPTIKELYSLILFSGKDPSGYEGASTSGLVPFIDTDYFHFGYGDTTAGERIIDAQFATSTLYVGTTMGGAETMFGVNFADGRIKGYPTGPMPGQIEDKGFFVLYVRGNSSYGLNDFVDNGDGTITDRATGLMWMQNDSGTAMNWEDALSYAKNSESAAYSDWRLPDVKELQSIVDYSRSPDTTNSAAIDPLFGCTQITNEAGQPDYPCFWTSTTHANWTRVTGGNAAYVCFGRAMGFMGRWMDVHGAGAQRSDPKSGDPAAYPTGHGPQGDAIRIYNYVRCVRDAGSARVATFIRGDANTDNRVDISDAIYNLGYLFAGDSAPTCLDAADGNDDGEVDIGDVIMILFSQFARGVELPEPYEECGIDRTEDRLDCNRILPCEVP